MAQNNPIPHILIQQTPHVINPAYIIHNIPTTPVKLKLGPLYDVPTEDDRSIQNLNPIFTMIENLD
jgi:hypothetical protein